MLLAISTAGSQDGNTSSSYSVPSQSSSELSPSSSSLTCHQQRNFLLQKNAQSPRRESREIDKESKIVTSRNIKSGKPLEIQRPGFSLSWQQVLKFQMPLSHNSRVSSSRASTSIHSEHSISKFLVVQFNSLHYSLEVGCVRNIQTGDVSP